jgi:hypothetical protein
MCSMSLLVLLLKDWSPVFNLKEGQDSESRVQLEGVILRVFDKYY